MNLPKYCSVQSKQFEQICPSLLRQLSRKSCEKKKEERVTQTSAGASKCFNSKLDAVYTVVSILLKHSYL